MAFCRKCGAILDKRGFCPNCAANESGNNKSAVDVVSKKASKAGLWKKIAVGVIVIVVVIVAVSHFTSTVDEPCDWCGNRPSVAYKMSDDSYSYVCKECSKKCAWCEEKATRHYENLAGMMVFVCDDCYSEISED